jgi:hypothetical protein
VDKYRVPQEVHLMTVTAVAALIAAMLTPVTPADQCGVWWSQDAPGAPGAPESGDGAGAAIATAGDDDEQALLVGVPRENDRRLVHVLPFRAGDGRLWHPGSGVDRFGFSLAGHR